MGRERENEIVFPIIMRIWIIIMLTDSMAIKMAD